MPTLVFDDFRLEVRRDAVVVDTNVLVGAFNPSDRYHEESKLLLDDAPQLIVLIGVVVEAWGLLAGRDKRRDHAVSMLQWLTTPGNADLVPDHVHTFASVPDFAVSSTRADCVDAMLVLFAHQLSAHYKLNPPLVIATHDKSDFSQYYRAYSISLWDFNSWQVEYFVSRQ